jgi:DNA-binding CsgD family transcriptional regulator
METKANQQTPYAAWIAAKRSEAEARGAKPLRHVPSRHSEGFYLNGEGDLPIPPTVQLAPGEILNPTTGEIITDCLSIKNLAVSLGVTSHRLTDEMERQGLVNRVLDVKEVPMVSDPAFRKPRYFHTPQVRKEAVADGLVITIKVQRKRDLILITPKGQDLLRERLNERRKPISKHEERRKTIVALAAEGKTAAQIAGLTQLPRSTVFRHLKEIRQAA